MTHDLRNPLHGILGFSQILRATPLDSSQVELVDQVTQAGQYMRKLLDDLSDLTVAESGGLTLDIGRHSVAGLLSNALELASATSALSATPMEVELEDKELAITTDSTRLLRVLVNLLSNAAKYGGSSPITLRAFDDGDAVVFEVADQGPGIEPDQLEVAFQPFERLANSAGAPGSGLGLALVRQIATLLQGTAELRSQVGVGTTAVLRLPKAIS
jgi:signal transduction histidine kinase